MKRWGVAFVLGVGLSALLCTKPPEAYTTTYATIRGVLLKDSTPDGYFTGRVLELEECQYGEFLQFYVFQVDSYEIHLISLTRVPLHDPGCNTPVLRTRAFAGTLLARTYTVSVKLPQDSLNDTLLVLNAAAQGTGIRLSRVSDTTGDTVQLFSGQDTLWQGWVPAGSSRVVSLPDTLDPLPLTVKWSNGTIRDTLHPPDRRIFLF